MIATTVLTALALGGCASDPAPSGPATSVSPSPSAATDTPAPTPPAAPTPPERPAAMDGTDDEAAKAAAEYFLELYAYTLQSGGSFEWEEVSDEGCQSCKSVSSAADQLVAREETYVGGELEPNGEISVAPVDGSPVRLVEVPVIQQAIEVLDAAGNEISHSDETEVSISVYVVPDDGWKIYDMVVG